MNEECYGKCSNCQCSLKVSKWFWEYEYDKQGHCTGRKRRAASSLTCPNCFKNYCIDDTFDGPWITE